MKTMLASATALAMASLILPSAAIAGKDKKAKPAEAAAAPAAGPEIAEEVPMTAQAATPAIPATPAQPATPADPAAGTPAAPATPAEPATAAPAQPSDPATILKTEFPTFDADKSGELNNAEFTTWMEALRKNAPGQAMTPDQQKTWITQSFAQADTSKNGTLSLDELTKFLVKA